MGAKCCARVSGRERQPLGADDVALTNSVLSDNRPGNSIASFNRPRRISHARKPKEQATIQGLLKKLDDSTPGTTEQIVDEIFSKFDKDKSGVLEKKEFKAMLEEVATYVTREYDKRWGDTGMDYSKEDFKQRFKWEFDKNFDGVVSKDEFSSTLKTLLDQVDD
eukprot:TRINITY_DN28017_c0_g1_i1.p1 TRINITY_DN28017_c0_g1~~TRINITY_DN28017_c0_g1_i1.p1  ORF type:complete len:164 (+),score=33.58 TRINITY_DN28017_c0_g1_i1:115-606(+)